MLADELRQRVRARKTCAVSSVNDEIYRLERFRRPRFRRSSLAVYVYRKRLNSPASQPSGSFFAVFAVVALACQHEHTPSVALSVSLVQHLPSFCGHSFPRSRDEHFQGIGVLVRQIGDGSFVYCRHL